MITMNCKSVDQGKAKRPSEDDENEDLSDAMFEEMLRSKYKKEGDRHPAAEHARHPAPHPASHPPAEQDPHPAPQPAKRWNDNYPLKNIAEPHEHDVLLGRGGRTNHHKGNKRYRKMVNDHKLEYTGLNKKNEKTAFAEKIVFAWRNQDPPGRFLQNDKKGEWYDVGDGIARKKTSQALREKKPRQDEFGELEEFDEVQLTPLSEEAYSPSDLLGLGFDQNESNNGEFKEFDEVQLTPLGEEANLLNGEVEKPDKVQLTPLSEEANSPNDILDLGFDQRESIEVASSKRKKGRGFPFFPSWKRKKDTGVQCRSPLVVPTAPHYPVVEDVEILDLRKRLFQTRLHNADEQV
ncbi:hypothetical protein FisN_26Lu027 [Fistulifera solaris]|uniref:DUF6824 domain-containing protein n=1 Tax=Fistulifera solaris TaxID=1519565 RepID=A0A1Z5KCE0_FISSO|nr:hypothetical protein FisN_26Lu027 [Fistulifera solaris]|eukprot:GAX23964.1 hypothetical protein FisN_26Lu027 [Fistulifera solaris]